MHSFDASIVSVCMYIVEMFLKCDDYFRRMGIKRTPNQYSVVNCKRETSFIDHHKRSPPSMNLPGPPPVTTKQW